MKITAIEDSVSLELKLLELMKEKGDWIDAEEMAKTLGISTKRTTSLINSLLHEIRSFDSDNLNLKILKGRGNLLEIKDARDYRKFRQKLIENIIIYKILFSIALNKDANLERLAMENFVSESLIKKRIANANQMMANLGVKVVTRKKQYLFQGDEQQVRGMLNILFWRLYRGDEWPFSGVNKEKIINLISQISLEIDLQMNQFTAYQIAYMFAINFSRYQRGFSVNLEEGWEKYRSICEWIDEKTDIYALFYKNYGFPKHEVDFLLIEAMTKSKIYNSLEHEAPDFWSVLEGTPAFEATERLVQKMETHTGKLSEEKRRLFLRYIYPCHLHADLFSNIIFSESGHHAINVSSYFFPVMRQSLKKLLAELYQESGLTLFLNEEYLIGEYILALSFFMPVQFQEKEITLFIDTDLSEMLEKLLIRQIFNQFGHLYNLKIITSLSEPEQNVDIVISTSAMGEHSNLKKPAQLFLVHPFLTRREIEDIEDYLHILITKNDE
ncbi:helix-turn-helix domain-containing protein [Lactococcus petauri]|uniref:helix-turn-helix domain-containing protein n=1 Tax=Lactococcus petauri TaxID=1940789 RepID=UPI00385211F2